MREIYGDDVFGLGALADGYVLAGRLIDALAVFVLAREARRGGVQLAPYAAIADVCAPWREVSAKQLPGLRALRAFPPTAELFSARRLRPTLMNAAAKDRWEAEAREIGLRHEAEIAALLERTSSPSH